MAQASKNTYFRFPLALLRKSKSPSHFFNDGLHYAAVNAGIGTRNNTPDDEWKELVSDLKQGQKKNAEAIIGAKICGISLGDDTGKWAFDSFDRIKKECGNSVIISVPSSMFSAAMNTFRAESGELDAFPNRQISWREFRVLVAISSLKSNTKGFSAAGWEVISHRACGFHRKEDFRAFEESPEPWPDHCIPLTRSQTTSTLDRLESLRFFIRHSIRRGERGGMTAYSFRHHSREDLARDCEEWQAWNRGETVRETRSEDQLLHAKQVAKREERIRKNRSQAASILETCKSPENPPPAKPLPALVKGEKQPAQPLKHSKPASDLQVTCKVPATLPASGLQGTLQHNEKCLSEKSSNEKSPNDLLAQALGSESQEEEGYLYEKLFVSSDEANRIMVRFPESFSSFRRARQITHPDGSKTVEEIQ